MTTGWGLIKQWSLAGAVVLAVSACAGSVDNAPINAPIARVSDQEGWPLGPDQFGSTVVGVAFSGGGEALAAMLGGKVTAGISGYGEFESQIKAGKLRALSLSSGKRLAGVDVPTLKEQGMNVEVVNWRAIMGAPGISADERKALTDTFEKMTKSKEWSSISARPVSRSSWITLTPLRTQATMFSGLISTPQPRTPRVCARYCSSDPSPQPRSSTRERSDIQRAMDLMRADAFLAAAHQMERL